MGVGEDDVDEVGDVEEVLLVMLVVDADDPESSKNNLLDPSDNSILKIT